MKEPCTTTERQLSLLVDGDLDAPESERLLAHVRVCPRCAAAREQIAALKSVAQEWIEEEVDAPEATWRQIEDRLPAENGESSPAAGGSFRQPSRSRRGVGLLLLAAAVILTVGVYFGGGLGPSSNRSGGPASSDDVVRDASADSIERLRDQLASADADLRVAAAEALGLSGDAAAPATEDLVTALSDPEATVRATAAGALGKIGGAAATVRAALAELLEDPDTAVQEAAARALVELDG